MEALGLPKLTLGMADVVRFRVDCLPIRPAILPTSWYSKFIHIGYS